MRRSSDVVSHEGRSVSDGSDGRSPEPERWPPALKTAVRLAFASPRPMAVWWGDPPLQFPNDRVVELLEPDAARDGPAADAWPALWGRLGPRARDVLAMGEGTTEGPLRLVRRYGGVAEERWLVFVLTPLPDDAGGPTGVLCAIEDVTERVVGERRMALLRELAACAEPAPSPEEAARRCVQALATDPADLPFAALWVGRPNAPLRLAGVTGIGRELAPNEIDLYARAPWPFAEALSSDAPLLVDDPRRAAVVRIPGAPVPAVLVVGIGPLRPVDEVLDLLSVVVGQVGSALACAAPDLVGSLDEGLSWLPTEAEPTSEHDAPPGPRARVVVADDERGVREGIARLLAPLYDVVLVADGEEALREVRRAPTDLVVTDLRMPGLDGFGLVRALREDETLRALPVIALSTCTGEEARAEGIASQADDWLVKPFTARELLARVAAQVSMARLRGELLEREAVLRAEAELLNEVARGLTAELAPQELLQRVTDAATELTGAEFGAFFQSDDADPGGTCALYTLSGTPREAFAGLGLPRITRLFAPTFRGAGVIRAADVREHPLFCGLPAGHVPVRSYLAVPVVSRSGEVLGGLFFGHPEPGVFTERAERLALGIAAQAAVALDNARLYGRAMQDLEERRRIEAALRDSERAYRHLVEALPAAVYTTDAEGRITLFNDAAAELWGRAPGVGNDQWCGAWRVLTTDGHPLAHDQTPMALLLRDGRPIDRAELVIERPDGARRHVLAHPRTVRDAAGRVVGGVNMLVDISRLKHVERELRDADRRKNEFIATLAHELRNPLAPLRTGLELLRRTNGDAATSGRARDMMERQLRHMVRLIDDLLDLSRITQGKFELRRERVALASVLESAVETSRTLIEQAGHTLEVDVPADPIWVCADLTRLSQVFANLLNNAARYTKPGGAIRLVVRADEREVRVAVRDSGIGIPRDQLTRIFDMFTQLDRTFERAQAGLGIGLSIARRLVELHGGRIEAHSEGLGRGSEFVVRLPVTAPPAIRSVPRPSAPVAGLRILVADDNVDAAETLALLFELGGNLVRVAHDGEEAVGTAASFQPDVVLLDIGMPRLDGYEACRRIRQHAAGREVVIVALTGWGQDGDKRRSEEAGFDHHLVKPVDLAELEKLLPRAAASRGAAGRR